LNTADNYTTIARKAHRVANIKIHHKYLNKDDNSQNIGIVCAVIMFGTFFDRFGIDDGRSDGIIKPSLAVVCKLAQRKDTSFQIRLGDSVVLDHSESTTSSTTIAHNDNVILLLPEDKEILSSFLYELMSHLQLVHLKESDGYNTLPLGLPGLCCKHCQKKTKTKKRPSCQIFPMYRRTIPSQVRKNLYNHLRKCEYVQPEIKMELKRLKNLENSNDNKDKTTKISREERQFFKRLWLRMGQKKKL